VGKTSLGQRSSFEILQLVRLWVENTSRSRFSPDHACEPDGKKLEDEKQERDDGDGGADA